MSLDSFFYSLLTPSVSICSKMFSDTRLGSEGDPYKTPAANIAKSLGGLLVPPERPQSLQGSAASSGMLDEMPSRDGI